MKGNNPFFMQPSPAVTVIIPVYNVAKYIEKCAESIFDQTLEYLEVIFVDDCSPDNSVEIIKNILSKYPNRISNTKILRLEKNSGLAAARKAGILEASGKYIIHCDGDDWVDTDLYEILYVKAKDSNADIVVCDEVMEFDGYYIPKRHRILPKKGNVVLKNWYKESIGLFCHNKLVKRELYTDNNILPWTGLNMWEDNALFARLFYYANTIVQLEGGPVYHYNRTNINAMTAEYSERQVNQMIEVADRLAAFFESHSDRHDYANTINAFKYLARINLITHSFKNYHRFLKTFPESKKIASHIDPSAFSSKGRVRWHMVRYGLAPVFIMLYKVKKLLNI
ncbi:MAG: glycosyltransferase [Muribaculaceae bacterium]|nr:glycosyltransferase [Muribaculaceae bacterium]